MSEMSERANMTGAHALAAALHRHGVRDVFGQSIPSALFLAAPHHGIRQIGYRTENAGAAMADAYARISGRVAVVAAQNGPAATLLVPGLAEALKASVPVVAIVQDVHRHFTDRNAFQELDHLALFAGVAKWVRRVAVAERIDDYVDMAFAAAASGRPGPAVLLVPLDLLDERPDFEASAPRRAASLGTFPLDRTVADPARIAEAADLIAGARRPLVIAGGGVHSSGAYSELGALQSLGLPVATTVMGKGAVAETDPLTVGVVGYFMAPRARSSHLRTLVTEADVVLLVGNRTNQNGTDSWSLYPAGARFIHLDVDGGEVGRNYESVRLVGDAKLTLASLAEVLRQRDLSGLKGRRAALADTIARAREAQAGDMARLVDMEATPIRPERIMAEIDAVTTPETVVVADASYASIWIANFLTARRAGQRFLTPRGIAGLGWGLPFALGAKVARPDAPVICVTGDGGFGHVWSELETARRMRLPVIVVVLNNQILGYQKHAELSLFGDFTDVCDFEAVDHAAIARACGCAGTRVERPGDLAPALRDALANDAVTVIDVITDQRAYPPITSFEGKDALAY
ncbi:acetolactate synthase catalytic subunit [Methylobacterium radiotolerans]|uniref:Thiamine pyrophosphate protein domain protein TPP-binding n=1 Tax=Methylobacterium radiotolerans (strain ATCC 27329 / DSM 1819 / JCM 2831 / NBRC 15690 / NCIMB 10815 / 0-1) TaxID=426355 RepID=B1LT53_METRJ|nr:acetolactate synthase catalytic subunit [Methylobacterium radiotolerans]ACB22359.1 thiamine pyrophosphate protein domain protein TPP-binding [Methylobacterium radiotolerans JCM 2831]KTS10510.1 acetolactate synthase catalytic subunit [Methylobacterium radiotolerans]KTS50029.1 acetolactate synthase catalytic subunit [Methylobacterium radiotolerans]GEM95500.1 acetolactate synthase large subunit [Methylobacterium radiotolerans]